MPRRFSARRLSLIQLSVVLAAIVALTSCGSDGPLITISRGGQSPTAASVSATPTAPPPTSGVQPTPVPTQSAPPLPTPTPAPTATALPQAASATPLPETDGFPGWLRVNGFGPVDFGASQALAETWIGPRFGVPVTVFENPECGLTIVSWDDFSLSFTDDGLVGWFYTSSVPILTSPSGVAPGISTPDLRVAYPGVDISETTLGLEFFFEVPAGYMGGFFSPDGQRVSEMFAGQNCFFR